MDILLLLLLAMVIELALGDPPNAIHPVAWMGKVASLLEKGCKSHNHTAQFLYGILLVLVVLGIFVTPVYFLLAYLDSLSFTAYVIIGALLLKSTFSLRGLRQAAIGIKKLLQEDKLNEANLELRSLVSRDTSGLSRPLLVSAAVESVAENTTDSFIAPLFYFLLFGVPGAVAYRVVNTLDAMIGYHGRYEYLGKFACRMDDVLNFIPARLTALLMVCAAFISRKNGRKAWQIAVSEHGRTESPNAGWPMAATAGALNVRLEKPAHYRLAETGAPPSLQTIDASLKLTEVTALSWIILCFIAGVIQIVITA